MRYTYVSFYEGVNWCKVGRGTMESITNPKMGRARAGETFVPLYVAGVLPFDCESQLMLLFGRWSKRVNKTKSQEVFVRNDKIVRFVMTRMNRFHREMLSATMEEVLGMVEEGEKDLKIRVNPSPAVPDGVRKVSLLDSKIEEREEIELSPSNQTPSGRRRVKVEEERREVECPPIKPTGI